MALDAKNWRFGGEWWLEVAWGDKRRTRLGDV
jgi:hypothetical protein